MSQILEDIRSAIASLDAKPEKANVGTIIELADGVAKVDGLSKTQMTEMLAFENGLEGIAFNLEQDIVGVVVMGDTSTLKEGMTCKTTGRLLSVPVGKELLGRVVDTLGNPVDGKGPINAAERAPIEKIAPGIMPREPVNQALQTGIMPIDAMIPIGRGQRELIIGDRSTGKTTIATDTIINQARINREGLASGDPNFRPVYSIYVAVGQKNSSVARLIATLEKAGALEYCVIVVAGASENAANQMYAPFAGAAIGEWFMENGMDALVVYDDLSKHAAAYRQISLILKRPSGREAYPGDVFYLHSRLLERAARLTGKGSLTALPIIFRPTLFLLRTGKSSCKRTCSTKACARRFPSVCRFPASVLPRRSRRLSKSRGRSKASSRSIAKWRHLRSSGAILTRQRKRFSTRATASSSSSNKVPENRNRLPRKSR